MNKYIILVLTCSLLGIGIVSTIYAASPTPSVSPSPSEEPEDSIREKVQEKVMQASLRPKAYIGTLTDIADTTFQIKSAEGAILQAQVDKNATAFVKIAKSTKKIAFADVAIGDFLIALGYKNGNSVLNTTRVLITDPLTKSKKAAVMGVVSKVEKDQVVISTRKLGNVTITPTESVRVTVSKDGQFVKVKFSSIKEGDNIIAAGNLEGSAMESARIHIL